MVKLLSRTSGHKAPSTPAVTLRASRAASLVGAVAACAVAVSGCSGSSHTSAPAASSSASKATAGGASATPGMGSRPTDPVAAAKRLAAEYDYTAAEAALAKANTPEATTLLQKVKKQAASARAVPGTSVTHIFYHSLIVDPTRAFRSSQARGYREYMVTIDQFRSELAQMYKRGYVLIHPEHVVARDKQGNMAYQRIMLPPGRKPMVLSVDDVNYYTYMNGDGFASNLTLTSTGRVENTYVDAKGTTHIGAYDVVPIIDDFVRQHPDFSYHGDLGSIAETGYNGVLGYRSSYRAYGHKPATTAARAKATKVAAAMRAEGWNFASHSYGHIDFTKSSLAQIKADSAKWDADVRPVVGATPELVFPFGADISEATRYSQANQKYAFLHDVEKFDYFFPIDATTLTWMQLTPSSWRQARINIDGISLARAAREHTVLDNFFATH